MKRHFMKKRKKRIGGGEYMNIQYLDLLERDYQALKGLAWMFSQMSMSYDTDEGQLNFYAKVADTLNGIAKDLETIVQESGEKQN